MSNNNLKFLLADDHAMIRLGLAMMIEDLAPGSSITQVTNLEQLRRALNENNTDIAVLDASYPDGSCLSVLPEIRKTHPHLKILIYTGIEEETHALQYFNAGANGFLTKLSEDFEVVEALKKMIEDGKYVSAKTQNLLLDSLQNPALINPLTTLTDREREIAELYAQGIGNIEIAAMLDIKQNTVSTMKKRVFDKLQIENIAQLISLFNTYR